MMFLLSSCNQEINIKSYNKNIDVEFGKKSKKRDISLIKFMDGFADSVKVFKNDSLVYSGFLETDESLSFAGLVKINNLNKNDKILIVFNSEKIEFEYQPKYPQLELYNFKDNIKLNFSKINQISNLE